MKTAKRIVVVDENRCVDCGFCREVNVCKSSEVCLGCLACYYACPYEARMIEREEIECRPVKIYVDDIEYEVSSRTTVKEALEVIGITFNPPGSKGLIAPCGLGGCWACAVLIDGQLERS